MNRVDVFGCPLDIITMEQALHRIYKAIQQQTPITHCALNTAKLINMQRNTELYRDVITSDLVTADGMGILLAARLAGHRMFDRVTGIDLMQNLLALCSERGLRPFVLGAKQHVLDTAIDQIRITHPEIRLAGARNGYFSPGEEDMIVQQINATKADCVFVGVPTPMKERFIARNRTRLKAPFVMGVGGSIDVIAGHVRRAPMWMQRSGLEWFYRLAQEPRRMWRRYLVTNTKFLGWLLVAMLYRVIGRSFAPLAQTHTTR